MVPLTSGSGLCSQSNSRCTWVAVGLRDDADVPILRAVSGTEPDVGEVALQDATKTGKWWDYMLGVVAFLHRVIQPRRRSSLIASRSWRSVARARATKLSDRHGHGNNRR
jgi:hypothetical protein